MQDFIDYLKKENIINNLKKFYKVGFKDNETNNFFNKIIENVTSFNYTNKINEDDISADFTGLTFDIFSKIYEKTRDRKDKKKYGEFYTPISIVNYILNAAEYNVFSEIEKKRVIDISCGSGSFIIQLIRALIQRYLKIYKHRSISNLTIDEAKKIISTIEKNIYGIDINPIACILCQINIQHTLFEVLKLIWSFEPNFHVPWFNIKNLNALRIKNKEKFNFVVGNPPYLFIRDIPSDQKQIIETSKFETNDGQYDYYQIFIELGVKILKKGGRLGYIVPDSLLALSNRSILRKFIYDHTKIKEIYHTGPKFKDPIVSNIILILEKEDNISERKNNQIKLKSFNRPEQTIPQEFIEQWNFKFLIHLNKTDITILHQLNTKFPKLKDLSRKWNIKLKLGRGVELTKTGRIIFCEKCDKYLPIPQKELKCPTCKGNLHGENGENIIFNTIPSNRIQENFQLFIYSIKRYQITQYKYIDTSKPGINYKDFNLYENRIIIRQLSQNGKICATHDKNLSLTSQSFYNLKIKRTPNSEFNNFYLLGLINSMLFSYFFIKSFGTYKKLFPRILIEKIKEFPIKIPISNKEKEIAIKIKKNVKLILEDFNKFEHLQNTIDSLVFNLYHITKNNQEYIVNYMKTLND